LQCRDLDSGGVEGNPAGPDIGHVSPDADETVGRTEERNKKG